MAHFPVRHPADLHLLLLDGVYLTTAAGPSLRWIKATTPASLNLPVHTLSARLARHLERRALQVRVKAPPTNPHAAMTWAQRLKRVFKIDIGTCATCGGPMKVIASIEAPAVIKRILAHLENGQAAGHHPEHPPRAAPQLTLPGLRE